jgi:hypothetical protein
VNYINTDAYRARTPLDFQHSASLGGKINPQIGFSSSQVRLRIDWRSMTGCCAPNVNEVKPDPSASLSDLYPGSYVPEPWQITQHFGGSGPKELFTEVLALTKDERQ